MYNARKALNLTFLVPVVLGICLLTIILPAHWKSNVLSFLSPLQESLYKVSLTFSGFFENVLTRRDIEKDNVMMRQDIVRLKNIIIDLEEHKIENERLRRMLQFQEESDLKLLPSQVIGHDASPLRKTLLINKGHRDGIRRRMSVVVAEGLVGTVVDVGESTCRILMLIDVECKVSAMVQDSREQGIVVGQGDQKRLRLKYLDRDANIHINDLILTSGTGEVFVKGLAMGRVQSIERDRQGILTWATVIPSVDFSRLEEVFVILEH